MAESLRQLKRVFQVLSDPTAPQCLHTSERSRRAVLCCAQRELAAHEEKLADLFDELAYARTVGAIAMNAIALKAQPQPLDHCIALRADCAMCSRCEAQ